MPLIALNRVSLAYGLEPLLDEVELQLEPGERTCIIGRNGAGKSTLLRVIAGAIAPDDGEVWRQPTLKMATLAQELPAFGATTTIYEAVAAGLDEVGRLLADYHRAAHAVGENDPGALARLEQLQHQLEAADGWNLNQRVEQVLTRLELPAERPVAELSGGWRRRVALAQALVRDPDLLLLDEPTNHLDIEAIQWLEEQLLSFRGGLLFITHDRAFLERLATRIVELDRGKLLSYPGSYRQFIERRDAELDAEAKAQARFDKKLAEEEVWIRQGIKARRTRNQGRVRALEAMRETHRQRRQRQGKANLTLETGESSGKLVIEAKGLGHRWSDKPVVEGLSVRIQRGDRVGLIGPNGVGKTTLLRLLLGQLEPQQGSVRLGTNLAIAYFDQLRAVLDLEASVIDNVAEGREFITIDDKRRHVISYLSDFLFSPARCRTPVKALSGGERNRLLLARLFSQPANLLVMDEPTNDLDIETLELLEELLLNFTGTLLLVSHDRAFLDNVVTGVLAFEGAGRVAEYVGGYSDWAARQTRQAPPSPPKEAPAKAVSAPPAPKPTKARKLSYKDQRELEQLPLLIETLEQEQAALGAQMADPAFYQQSQAAIQQANERAKRLDAELADAYERWEALEQRREEGA